MSRNDYYRISKKGRYYVIFHNDADTDEGSEIQRFTSLRKAIQYAQELQQNYETASEYGLSFSI